MVRGAPEYGESARRRPVADEPRQRRGLPANAARLFVPPQPVARAALPCSARSLFALDKSISTYFHGVRQNGWRSSSSATDAKRHWRRVEAEVEHR